MTMVATTEEFPQSIQATSSTHPGTTNPVRANPSLRYIYIYISLYIYIDAVWNCIAVNFPSAKLPRHIFSCHSCLRGRFQIFLLPPAHASATSLVLPIWVKRLFRDRRWRSLIWPSGHTSHSCYAFGSAQMNSWPLRLDS